MREVFALAQPRSEVIGDAILVAAQITRNDDKVCARPAALGARNNDRVYAFGPRPCKTVQRSRMGA